MICPRCGTRSAPGAERCGRCGSAFTRRSAARVASAQPRERPVAGYRTYQRGNGVGRAVVAWLAVLFLVAVAIIALLTVFSSSVIKPYIGQRIEQALSAPTQQPSAAPTPAPTQAPGAAPASTAAAGKSSNQVVITEQDLNQGIAEHQDQLGVLDSVQVKIESGQLAVMMKSHGVSGTYRGQVSVRDGEPVLTNGHIDGLLGYVIPTAQLEDLLNQQIRDAVTQTGVAVQTVTLQPGEMIVSYA